MDDSILNAVKQIIDGIPPEIRQRKLTWADVRKAERLIKKQIRALR